ncbi:MAG: ABC transporter substrate-binding protein [Chromatiaceae bacterium]|nr:ABC transporter substrate-binding protein [Gammaproteobacteria bacterium]MCP5314721.1 ABC transporter substrate-binding protein [Chromatiaceae bacterium]
MKSRYWLLAGILLAGGVQAVPHYGPGIGPGPGAFMRGPAGAAQMNTPALALRAGMDKLLNFLDGDQRPSDDALTGFLDSEIAPFFDFDYMAQSAGGRLFEQLDEAQQQSMVEDIKHSFLGKMAEKLGAYEQQQVRFLPPRGNNGRTAQVSVAVLNPGSYPARLDFRMYRSGDKWLVYDVAANGQSAIVHYRTQLMRQMQEQRMQQMRQMAPMRPPMPPYAVGRAPIR